MINTLNCTPTEALAVIETYWGLRLPIYLHGQPGVGKSQMVAQLAAKRSASLHDVRLSQKTAADIGGLPALDHDAKTTAFYEPDFLPRNNAPSILFLDELNTAADDVKAAAYGLILERRIGRYHLPEECRVIAAGNRLEDGALGGELGSALADRFLHIVIEPNAADWLSWAIANSIDRTVMAFLHARPQYLIHTPEMIEQGHTIVPTPRSWERVSNLMNVRAATRSKEIAIAGLVGDAVAAEFFLVADDLASMASVETILNTPVRKLATVIPASISGLYALAYALAASVSEQTGGRILDVIAALPALNSKEHDGLPLADIQTLAMTHVLNRMYALNIDCSGHPAFLAYDRAREAEGAGNTETSAQDPDAGSLAIAA